MARLVSGEAPACISLGVNREGSFFVGAQRLKNLANALMGKEMAALLKYCIVLMEGKLEKLT